MDNIKKIEIIEKKLQNTKAKIVLLKHIDEELYGYKDVPNSIKELLYSIKKIAKECSNDIEPILDYLYENK